MPRRAPNPNGNAIVAPFTGLYLDRPPHIIPPTGFQACNNVRIFQNQITNKLMGWIKLTGPLNGPICGGHLFSASAQVAGSSGTVKYLVVATPTDVYVLNSAGHEDRLTNQVFITPIYATGTVSASGTAVTGSGTAWNTSIGSSWRKNARPGDQIFFGSATQNSPTASWFTITSVASDTSLTLTSSAGTIGAGTSYTIRQCLGNDTEFGRMRFEEYLQAGTPFNTDIIMGVNGGGNITGFGTGQNASLQDPIFVWAIGNTFGSYLSSLAFNGLTIRRFQNVMVVASLLGPTLSPTRQYTSMASSDNGLPTSFSTGVAFQGFVSDTPFFISAVGRLGNSLMIYGGGRDVQGSIVSAQFVGFPTIWQFSTVIQGRGTFTQDTMIEFADRHEFIHYDGMYRYNGLFIQVCNDHIWRNLTQNIALTRIGNAVCIPAIAYGDVIWAVPLVNDLSGNYQNFENIPSYAPVFSGFTEHYMEQPNNYLFKPFTMRDAPFTAYIGAGANNQAWCSGPGPIVGDVNGNVFLLYSSDLQAGSPYTSFCQFADRIVAGERSRGLIKRIYPHWNATLPPPIPPATSLTAAVPPNNVYTISNGTNVVDGFPGLSNTTLILSAPNGANTQQWSWNGSKFALTALGFDKPGGAAAGGYLADNGIGQAIVNGTGDTWTVTASGLGYIIKDAITNNYLAIVSGNLVMSASVQTVWSLTDPVADFNLSVRLQMKDRVGGPVVITDTQTVDVMSPVNRFSTHYRRGRVANVAFSTTGGSFGTPWELYGYDWDLPTGSPGGQR